MKLNCINFTTFFVFIVVVVCGVFFFIALVCDRINGNHGSIKINNTIDLP